MSVITALNAIPDIKAVQKAEELIQFYSLRKEENFEKPLRDLVKNPRDFFFLTSFMSPQQKAKEIELFLIDFLGGISVPASADRGDAIVGQNVYELKTSTTNQKNLLNIGQIRLWQKIDFYLCSYIYELELEKSKFYLLTKEQMRQEVRLMGSFSRGTRKVNQDNKNREFSLSISVYNYGKSENTRRWEDNYFNMEIFRRFVRWNS